MEILRRWRERRRGEVPLLLADLDGTLVEPTDYGHTAAVLIDALHAAGIEVWACTHKTAAEMEPLAERLNLDGYFIEGAAAVHDRNGRLAAWGWEHQAVRAGLIRLRDLVGDPLPGYADMTDAEVARLTGLAPADAARARCREFSESFRLVTDGPARREAVAQAARALGLRCTHGGQLLCLTGPHDKGDAVRWLREHRPEAWVVAVGDAEADAPMLERADAAVGLGPSERWRALERADRPICPGGGGPRFVAAALTPLSEWEKPGGDHVRYRDSHQ